MSVASLASVAELFGELLLRELSEERLLALRSAQELEPLLAEMDLQLPAPEDRDLLAADFFDLFVNPQSGFPLVQSLYEEGNYEGNAAKGVRQVAEAAGLDYDQLAALGATPDHLGSQLVVSRARLFALDGGPPVHSL